MKHEHLIFFFFQGTREPTRTQAGLVTGQKQKSLRQEFLKQNTLVFFFLFVGLFCIQIASIHVNCLQCFL